MQRPEPREGAEDQHLDTAEDLLAALSPRSTPWRDDPDKWIYRGQADADWRLTALAVRSLDAFRRVGVSVASVRPGYNPTEVPESRQRYGLHQRMLARFRRGLDRSGLEIPRRPPRLDPKLKDDPQTNLEPPRDSFPLMALAQHHGLPTYLLDWTRRAYVAAYFAAADAADTARPREIRHLAVWALRREVPPEFESDIFHPTEGPLLYEAPAGTNPNMHAQAGLFTALFSTESDGSLEEHFVRLRSLIGFRHPLKRLTLPIAQAPKLLRLLSYEGVDGAAMFPGADGVVRAMRESAMWDEPAR